MKNLSRLLLIAMTVGTTTVFAGGFHYHPMGSGSSGQITMDMQGYAEAAGNRTFAYGTGDAQLGQYFRGPNVMDGSFGAVTGGYGFDSSGHEYSSGWGNAGGSLNWRQNQQSWSAGGFRH